MRLTPLQELQLLEAHRAGEAGALGELLRSYQRRVYSICFRMVNDVEDASDLTQDSLVKVIEGLEGYDGRSKLSTWVIRVTMNCCISFLRKRKLRRHGSLDEPVGEGEEAGAGGNSLAELLAGGGEPRPWERVEQREREERLMEALGKLEAAERGILVLRDVQGLDYQQIGEVLDLPLGTVKSRLFRARAALRRGMGE